MTPIDEFKPENIERYRKYLEFVSRIDPIRLKFVNEKHLCGTDLFNRKARPDPLTGIMDAPPVDSDFRRAYNIIAMMSMNPVHRSLLYTIGHENGNAALFLSIIEQAVAIS